MIDLERVFLPDARSAARIGETGLAIARLAGAGPRPQ